MAALRRSFCREPPDSFIFKAVLPGEEYQRRLRAREDRAAHYEKIHIRLGNIRLGIFLAAAVMAWETFHGHRLSAWWLAALLAAFITLAAFHSRILRARDLAGRAVKFYSNGLARIEDRWMGSGETGERFADPHHVYAADLDLFCRGGLFELLSTARTRMGEERLAAWLLAPSPVEQVRERHEAVTELRGQIDLREDLAVLGEDARVGVHPTELVQWAEAPNRMGWPPLRLLATVLAALAVAGVVVWIYWGTITPLLLVLLTEGAVMYRLRKPMEEVLHGAEHALRDLALLSGVLTRVEQHSFQSPRLLALQRALTSHEGGAAGGMSASRAIARLGTIGDLIDSRDNLFVRVFDVPLMYSVQLALAAERWRRAHGPEVRGWLEAIGEIEAMLSLAAYSYEHPADPFPEFAEGAACLDSEELGHPLLPAAACVRNSVKVCDGVRVLLVSGSNMSGKSTLLRAVGINVVLAMAGAPVRARRLRLTPLQPGASIRINDSLQEGSSRFYAEITRLRRLFDLAGDGPPLLFLLDELLQGTNSKDRRIGAEGVVRALVERGAIGLLSTHDLALTEIGGALDGHSRNVHFQDEFAGGKMTFDYKLRDGVVTKSNGLELMRSIGLDV
ncbi:MAG TPA: mismatch repair protein [Candidatus Angelobacter sp.]